MTTGILTPIIVYSIEVISGTLYIKCHQCKHFYPINSSTSKVFWTENRHSAICSNCSVHSDRKVWRSVRQLKDLPISRCRFEALNSSDWAILISEVHVKCNRSYLFYQDVDADYISF